MGAIPVNLCETHSVGADTREWLVPGNTIPALFNAQIELCGVSLARTGFSFVRHTWDRSQLLISLSPGGTCWQDGEWRPLASGEGYITPPATTHAYRCLPGYEWLLAWAILVDSNDARMVAGEQPTVVEGDGRPLHDAILNLHREHLGAADPTVTSLWADVVVALVHRQLSPIRVDQRLWRLWEEVDADLGHHWTLGDLARHAGIGTEQLRRLCVRHLGASPMQHLTRLRMRRAAALLGSGGRNVGDVARAVGYDNAFAFSTAFRRHHGVPPSQLRR